VYCISSAALDLQVTPIYFSHSLGSKYGSLSLVFSLSVAFEHEVKITLIFGCNSTLKRLLLKTTF